MAHINELFDFETLLGPPPGTSFSDLNPILKMWMVGRVVLFFVLITLPFLVLQWETITRLWFAPLMGVVAAAIPASGAPVAGGIVFLPVLDSFGVCPRDAVAFSAATQFFGVGIFAPLNWLIKDKNIFIWPAIKRTWVPSAIGLVR
jgi:hypothetical protein